MFTLLINVPVTLKCLSVPQNQMSKKRDKKSLFCFCHFGGNIVVNEDKSVSYKGGSVDGIVINEDTKYDAFVGLVCQQLSITPRGKSFQYSVKFDKSCLLPLKDQSGLNKLLEFNDGSGCVYITETKEVAPLVVSTRYENMQLIFKLSM